jgi:hypothetical protein
MPTLTICGGGNAAHVLIPLIAGAGWDVKVYAPLGDESARLQAGIARQGGLRARFADGTSRSGTPSAISARPADVIPGAACVLLALPAFAHGPTLEAIAPYLEQDAVVGALPARGGFDYQAEAILRRAGRTPRYFGLQTLPWACRIVRYGEEVAVLGTKAVVDLASCPPDEAAALAARLSGLLDVPLRPIRSFLALTLANTGQLIHPGIMYGLCSGREKATYDPGDVPFFYQGVDDFTAGTLQAMSDDVQALAAALADALPGFDAGEVLPLYDWVCRAYAGDIADDSSLASAFRTNRAYAGLRLPARPAPGGRLQVDFSARYLAEDVPYGLVVVHGIAALAGVPTPALDRVITWAEERLGQRFLPAGSSAGSRAPQCFNVRELAQLAGSPPIQLQKGWS